MRKTLTLILFLVVPAVAQRPPIRHVFTIVLENKSYDETFGPNSQAPYLSKQLTAQGELLTNYYGIGHNSLDNYIALVSGQAPNVITQSDCQIYQDFVPGSPVQVDINGQIVGQGCVFPSEIKTIADQLATQQLSWRGYMEDMSTPCLHPALTRRIRLRRRNREINTPPATIRLYTSIRSSTHLRAALTMFP